MSEHEELNELKRKYNILKADYSDKAYKYFQTEKAGSFINGFLWALFIVAFLNWIFK
ncbi:hypothetical protein R5R49_03965 [Oenococcus oeni]|uniref:hypothetical protein n=1 Tax=Oenococcus oeni TaxID=1247 RepID=UPI000277BB69|nr:hypothetical protein [Oenococcus oeni]EJO04117.1 hypothetical protein AWRIB548_1733 [Oenococcus oeni AWRIB548]EJO04164.1 hypothetical protein AWRIB548_1780 [Oenococcus oeni AWRIB548]KEP86542.1 hypothetical protein X278_02280 [Oenococcus oeni IOEB_0205]